MYFWIITRPKRGSHTVQNSWSQCSPWLFLCIMRSLLPIFRKLSPIAQRARLVTARSILTHPNLMVTFLANGQCNPSNFHEWSFHSLDWRNELFLVQLSLDEELCRKGCRTMYIFSSQDHDGRKWAHIRWYQRVLMIAYNLKSCHSAKRTICGQRALMITYDLESCHSARRTIVDLLF